MEVGAESDTRSNRIAKRITRLFQRSRHNIRGLGEAQCRLVIPAYDAVSGACHTFRTPHHPLLRGDEATNAAEVALATAAAPTYFASAKVRNMIANSTYVDGGVWANSPSMAAIIEAVCYLDVPLDRIDILSIGTTDEPFNIKKFRRSGWLGWRKSTKSTHERPSQIFVGSRGEIDWDATLFTDQHYNNSWHVYNRWLKRDRKSD